nr:hypothetical protein BHI3_27100 [Bacteriovorax sp. HI3]
MKNLSVLALLLLAVSCSSTPDVRPGADGIHSISLLGEDVKDTEGAAHKQARAYCTKQGKTIEYLSDDTIKATPTEVSMEKSLFKDNESVATDIKFKCN